MVVETIRGQEHQVVGVFLQLDTPVGETGVGIRLEEGEQSGVLGVIGEPPGEVQTVGRRR